MKIEIEVGGEIVAVIDHFDDECTVPWTFVQTIDGVFEAVSEGGHWVIGRYGSCNEAIRAIWRDNRLWDQAHLMGEQ